MIRAALAVSLLSGCAVVEHVQVLPTLSSTAEIGCCVLFVELPPSATLSVTVSQATGGANVNLGAKWRF